MEAVEPGAESSCATVTNHAWMQCKPSGLTAAAETQRQAPAAAPDAGDEIAQANAMRASLGLKPLK